MSVIEDGKKMLDELDKSKNIKVQNSDQFRESLANFIVQQTGRIQEQDEALSVIMDEFLDKVRTHEVDSQELRQWFKSIQDSKANYARALLDIFRPTNSAPNPLLAPKESQEDEKEVSSQLTSDQLNTIVKFQQMMEKATEKFEHRDEPVASDPAGED